MSTLAASPLLALPEISLGQPAATADRATPADEAQVDPAQVEMRLRAVGTLLERSSLERQIEASGAAQALERRDLARDAYRRARDAHKVEDYAAAARLVSESSALMFEAAKMASPASKTDAGRRADFDARMASVKSLVAARKRISAEKPGFHRAGEAAGEVETMLGEASRLWAADEKAGAEALLKKAYLVSKAAVSSMRSGDTLVRSLNFATKEEEYRYEIDRNDTHKMLVESLVAEGGSATGTDAMRERFVAQAAELRRQAEEKSAGSDYEGAIGLAEDSTRHLLRAIRSLGIFVPG